mmetsp:Transcript_14325/g.19960  ORF Transcript_14325/g.19960 Transcript_14325/m.19960 type:complete len:315 (+) Transcript_14325:134-1078(+)
MSTKQQQGDGPAKTKRKKKPEGAPKRPLSAYNIFFQHERRRLILEAVDNGDASSEDIAEWLKSGRNRPHRKSHGKIAFLDLVRTVSAKWKKLSDADKQVFKLRAEGEQIRYKEELQVWKNSEAVRKNKENRLEHERKCAALPKEETIRELSSLPDTQSFAPIEVASGPGLISADPFDWFSSKTHAQDTGVQDSCAVQQLEIGSQCTAQSLQHCQQQVEGIDNLEKMQKIQSTLLQLKGVVMQATSLYGLASRQMAQSNTDVEPADAQNEELYQHLYQASLVADSIKEDSLAHHDDNKKSSNLFFSDTDTLGDGG